MAVSLAQAHKSKMEICRNFKYGESIPLMHVTDTPFLDRKVKGQGHAVLLNFLIGECIITYEKSAAEMLTVGFDRVTVGFSK